MSDDNLRQIWRMPVSQDDPQLVYELRSHLDIPLSEAFSPIELSAFEEWREASNDYPTANEIFPDRVINKIKPSPDGQNVAWIESIVWIPWKTGTTTFYVSKLIVLNLIDKEKMILYEVDQHPDGSWLTGNESGLADFAWSPDGQKIVVVEGHPRSYIGQAKLIDVFSGKITPLEFSGDRALSPTWSPNGQSLALTAAKDNRKRIVIIEFIDDNFSERILEGVWGVIHGVDWSPDGQTIVFAASVDTLPNRLKLYTVDVKTGKLIEISPDEHLDYQSPKWSPNGQFIAVNVAPNRLDAEDMILIYDFSLDQTSTILKGEYPAMTYWAWSQDSQRILAKKDANSLELFDWQSGRVEIIKYPAFVDYGHFIGLWHPLAQH